MIRRKRKLVFGVGRNDAGYPVTVTAVIGGKQRQLWICPFYSAWRGMLERCYSAKLLALRPTYVGCTVTPEWHSFSAFREWMDAQDWKGRCLDKDIIIKGNKVYGPETCVFVSIQLNSFLVDSGAARGEWPIGVIWHKRAGKFAAACNNPFIRKEEHLGYFVDPAAAHEAWRARKHQHACQHAGMQTDPRIAEALCSRYAYPYMETSLCRAHP